MLRHTLVAACLATCSLTTGAQTWAIAESKHASGNRSIVFRYISEFSPGHKRESQPIRVVFVWRYQGTNGMPAKPERERMERLEDLLEPALEKSEVATLVLVSTGEGLREWTYYAKSEELFFAKLNQALKLEPKFPIEVHAGADPSWSTFENFRKQVRK
ncbi:MAG: DUF695 domain-containing protein [Thiobacillus sp.]|nr:DUF695 domain-containing protein [Thiobacillus sp.]